MMETPRYQEVPTAVKTTLAQLHALSPEELRAVAAAIEGLLTAGAGTVPQICFRYVSPSVDLGASFGESPFALDDPSKMRQPNRWD